MIESSSTKPIKWSLVHIQLATALWCSAPFCFINPGPVGIEQWSKWYLCCTYSAFCWPLLRSKTTEQISEAGYLSLQTHLQHWHKLASAFKYPRCTHEYLAKKRACTHTNLNRDNLSPHSGCSYSRNILHAPWHLLSAIRFLILHKVTLSETLYFLQVKSRGSVLSFWAGEQDVFQRGTERKA